MEFRGWVEVQDIHWDDEDVWGPWFDLLHDQFVRFGPALGWEEDAACVVMSMEAESRGAAARVMFAAVADSLVLRGLSDLYPRSIRVEEIALSEDAA